MDTARWPALCLGLVLFAFGALRAAAVGGEAGVREVTVAGSGNDREAALRDAWRKAIKQVAGVLVDSKQKIENDELLEDLIRIHSRGSVESYDVLSEAKSASGGVEIRINAKVSQTLLVNELEKRGLTALKKDIEKAAIDEFNKRFRDKNAQEATKAEMLESAEEFLELALADLQQRLLNTLDVSTKGKLRPDAKKGVINADIVISVDTKKYREFYRNLDSMLEKTLGKPAVLNLEGRVGEDNVSFAPHYLKSLFDGNIGGIAICTSLTRPQKLGGWDAKIPWRVYRFDPALKDILQTLVRKSNNRRQAKKKPSLVVRIIDAAGYEFGNEKIVPPVNWRYEGAHHMFAGDALLVLPVLDEEPSIITNLYPGKPQIAIPVSIPMPDMEIEGNPRLQIDWEIDD